MNPDSRHGYLQPSGPRGKHTSAGASSKTELLQEAVGIQDSRPSFGGELDLLCASIEERESVCVNVFASSFAFARLHSYIAPLISIPSKMVEG